jgi:hypothetical protein
MWADDSLKWTGESEFQINAAICRYVPGTDCRKELSSQELRPTTFVVSAGPRIDMKPMTIAQPPIGRAQIGEGPSAELVEGCARANFQNSGAGPFGACRDFLELQSVRTTDSLIQAQVATVEATTILRVKQPYNTGSVLAGSCGPVTGQSGRMLQRGELISVPIILHFQKWTSGWRCQ